MKRFLLSFALLLAAGTALAQKPTSEPQATPYYPAPPPELAPKTEQGMSVDGLTSPLAQDQAKIARTVIDSDAEAELFANADKIAWGRYAKAKGEKPGTVTVTKGAVWTVKGRLDSTAPGSEGDYASIEGAVEKITAHHVVIRGEVAFRVAKIEDGALCKMAGELHFRRSGRSHVWRLAGGENPCDGSRELFDLVYDKPPPAEKKPAARRG
ncbi:hypothetical protein [Enhydrobacter sp.]|jgi:hypothetical protein|uniref:hypothetical protein n=1 Tax=Enhydrobacter sp. TaxID=1894999 RepID=UPI00262C653B|nr:hypothetical protein [Enhydrobacter sp.]WIM11971.1 MAG: hypothetical protein OJF58_002931 [Enhydrobacter sp.]